MSERLLKPASFPFTAVYGAEQAKEALLCAMVNPRIKGVLIKGTSGVAKTTLARSLSGDISGKKVINVPLNVTDEQLLGTMDLEYAIKEGVIRMQEGILHRANGNLLYLDDVNLFDQRMISSLMDSILSGRVKVERENISEVYDCNTTVIATMNMTETYVNPHMMDYFDISTVLTLTDDVDARAEIVKRNAEFFEDPDSFVDKWKPEEDKLIEKLTKAKKLLPEVKISKRLMSKVTQLCMSLGSQGYRGDLSTINVSMALAALDGRNRVNDEDVEKAVVYCLSHRRRPETAEEREKRLLEKAEKDHAELGSTESNLNRLISNDKDKKNEKLEKKVLDDDVDEVCTFINPEEEDFDYTEAGDVIFEIGEKFEIIDMLEAGSRQSQVSKDRAKRNFAQSNDRDGKYVRAVITEKKNPDMAFDATIRAAAPHQRSRHQSGANPDMSVVIESQDLREKVRQKRTSSTFLFMVDTSGSLIIRSRMMAVKGAILSMLGEHYVKRDRVGFMTFSEKAIQMLLPPTRSVDCIYNLLDDLPVGEKTPLTGALLFADDFMDNYSRKHPGERCYIIIFTDGKANVPVVPGADAVTEMLEIAKTMDLPEVEWMVVDTGGKGKKRTLTSMDVSKNECAVQLARSLRAKYFKLDELKKTAELVDI